MHRDGAWKDKTPLPKLLGRGWDFTASARSLNKLVRCCDLSLKDSSYSTEYAGSEFSQSQRERLRR